MTETEPVWAAVIVAAGSGTRFKGPVPKQFIRLSGMPVIDHSIRAFHKLVPTVVVVLPPNPPWKPPEGIHTVQGGERRQDSVLAGLVLAMDLGATHVLVHDGARPLVDGDTIKRVITSTEETGTGLPCMPVRDTVKRTRSGKVVETVDRTDLQLAQTPQGFKASLLLDALKKSHSVTDEASAVEAIGISVSVVPGSRRNLKLTDSEDARLLEDLLPCRVRSLGTGLDFHPFSKDRPLFFCGCRLSDSGGLSGHSDGDAVLHAVADAILAAARIGDIGTLFPPDDAKWKDSDSSLLLGDCMALARDNGWELVSLDVTVIGEKPRISPRRNMFTGRLSEILQVPVDRVWIKGTTTNTIGELARGKGVGCHALVELARTE